MIPPKEYRSVAFWYADTEDARAKLLEAAMQYPPAERENFLRDVYRGAVVQLAEVNSKEAP